MSKEQKRPARMTLELPPKAREKLERLSRETDQSLSEVIRRALSLYDLMGAEAMAGNKLIIRGREGEREVLIAEFTAVGASAHDREAQTSVQG
jgi:predicted transcriptional regulator